MELKKPQILKAEWQDIEGNVTDKSVLGEDVKLIVETKKNIENVKTITFKIYPEGADTIKEKPLKKIDVPVKDVKVKVKESDGTEHEGITNEEGIAEFPDLIPVNNYFTYKELEIEYNGQ